MQWRLPVALLLGSIAVDAWLWWRIPALQSYCGLSGIPDTLLVFGLVPYWRKTHHLLVLIVGVAAAAKIVMEIGADQSLLIHIVWPGVPSAHAAGFLCGIAFAGMSVLLEWHERRRSRTA